MYRDDFNSTQKEFYWSAPRVMLAFLLVVVMVYGVGFLANGGDWVLYRFWAPKMENTRRLVYTQTDSFVEGKISSISQERLAYESAEAGSAQQRALRTMIITEAGQVDNAKLPLDMQMFINQLKGRF